MKKFALLLPLFVGCADVDDPHAGHHHHEHEIMTTVELTFSDGTNDPIVALWADPEDDGSPTIDDITLEMGVTYDVAVRFLNEMETPTEDVTPEILDEADQHQVFFTGTAVSGPASTNSDAVIEHVYMDEDLNGDPLGLDNEVTSVMAGSGDLEISLRHMPPEDGTPVKTSTLAADVAAGGFGAIGGANDVSVTFPLTVNPVE